MARDEKEEQAGESTSSNSADTKVEARTVRGSHSTKVHAVVEQLLQLQYTHPGEKVLIFSSVSTYPLKISTFNNMLELKKIPMSYSGLLFWI